MIVGLAGLSSWVFGGRADPNIHGWASSRDTSQFGNWINIIPHENDHEPQHRFVRRFTYVDLILGDYVRAGTLEALVSPLRSNIS